MGLPYNISIHVGHAKPVAMKFIINEILEYDPLNCRLVSRETGDNVQLSQTSNRLLTLLIENNRQPVSREMLFEKVWDDYGMTASNPNLNQHISILRKEFVRLGSGKELIKTLPKIGFSFDAEIQACGRTDNYIEPTIDNPVRKIQGSTIMPYTFGALFLLLVAVLLSILLLWNRSMKTQMTYFLGNYQSCSIYAFTNIDESHHAELLQEYSAELTDKGVHCDKPKLVYVSGESMSDSQYYQRHFMAVCGSASTQNCTSLYRHTSVNHDD